MKKHLNIPLLAVCGGAVCSLLRLLQNRSGFEADTGLPVPGDPFGILLPAALLLLAAALLLLVRQLPGERENSSLGFQDHFVFSIGAAVLVIVGLFLWLLSGAVGLLSAVGNTNPIHGLYIPVDRTTLLLSKLPHGLAVLSAVCLFPAAAAAAGRRGKRTARKEGLSSGVIGNLILLAVICLVLRLTLVYREVSVNASQQTYYVELLALMLLILALYRLSSFAFHVGSVRRFTLFAAMAVVLCIVSAADASAFSDWLFFAGGGAMTLGFLLLCLDAPTEAPTPSDT